MTTQVSKNSDMRTARVNLFQFIPFSLIWRYKSKTLPSSCLFNQLSSPTCPGIHQLQSFSSLKSSAIQIPNSKAAFGPLSKCQDGDQWAFECVSTGFSHWCNDRCALGCEGWV